MSQKKNRQKENTPHLLLLGPFHHSTIEHFGCPAWTYTGTYTNHPPDPHATHGQAASATLSQLVWPGQMLLQMLRGDSADLWSLQELVAASNCLFIKEGVKDHWEILANGGMCSMSANVCCPVLKHIPKWLLLLQKIETGRLGTNVCLNPGQNCMGNVLPSEPSDYSHLVSGSFFFHYVRELCPHDDSCTTTATGTLQK